MNLRITITSMAAAACLLSGLPTWAQAPERIVGMNLQQALLGIREGRQASSELDAKYGAIEDTVRSMQVELERLRTRLRDVGDKISDDARTDLTNEINRKSNAIDRTLSNAREDLEQDRERIVNRLGARLIELVGAIAQRSGYALVIDSSSPSASVLVLATEVDITSEVIREYDRKYPGGLETAAASGS